ncbi:MAG TPA: hypothetical protein VGQ17_17405 [Gemmatimonadales bacterium]|jgi:hypothetical protein|nr:hypothetical protein [Gemmatimonadales bacterium]
MAEQTLPDPDSKDVLYEAARSAIRDQSARAEAERIAAKAKTNPRRVWLMAAAGVIGLVVLILRPGWLTGPTALPPEPPAIVAASLRLTLLRERQRVLDFTVLHGRLPSSLAEAGGAAAGITFTPRALGRFELSASIGDSLIVLGSTDSVAAFLGGSLHTLARRRRP